MNRTEIYPYWAGMTGLFAAYFLLMFYFRKAPGLIPAAIFSAIIFRVATLFFLPNLSDDFYRFVWDGRLLIHGQNPYLSLPSQFFKEGLTRNWGLDEIYPLLNSPDYYSVYPPVCQFFCWVSASLFPSSLLGSVFILKLLILISEILSIGFLWKLLQKFRLPGHSLLWYALNPLIITELTGNLHFEAIMITGMLGAVFALTHSEAAKTIFHKRLWIILSAFAFAVSVCSKLIPVIFLLFLIRKMGFRKAFVYGLIVGVFCIMMFTPFLAPDTFQNILKSTRLYYTHFEFNASVYYLLKAAGYLIAGYNWLVKVPFLLPLCFLSSLFYIETIRTENYESPYALFLRQCGWAMSIYLLLSTTVNPWYLSPCIAFFTFSQYRFTIVWSMVFPVTYFTYHKIPYQENMLLVLLEYALVLGFLYFELRKNKVKTQNQ
ncbi:MAG: hypothetical protein K1X92_09895 [Bacteroidia bacterium]|nr:hypothetical protein [Bacteroidia bacterium]